MTTLRGRMPECNRSDEEMRGETFAELSPQLGK